MFPRLSRSSSTALPWSPNKRSRNGPGFVLLCFFPHLRCMGQGRVPSLHVNGDVSMERLHDKKVGDQPASETLRDAYHPT